jgi:ribose transport system permease protein
VGGNRDAAILAGMPARKVEFIASGLSGMLAAIPFASRIDAAQPSVREGWLMGAILGRTSLRGGQGSIVGTVLGALPLTALTNGTVLMNVSDFRQRVIVGAVVLIAVLVDLLRRRSN